MNKLHHIFFGLAIITGCQQATWADIQVKTDSCQDQVIVSGRWIDDPDPTTGVSPSGDGKTIITNVDLTGSGSPDLTNANVCQFDTTRVALKYGQWEFDLTYNGQSIPSLQVELLPGGDTVLFDLATATIEVTINSNFPRSRCDMADCIKNYSITGSYTGTSTAASSSLEDFVFGPVDVDHPASGPDGSCRCILRRTFSNLRPGPWEVTASVGANALGPNNLTAVAGPNTTDFMIP